jgi:hypothetical protein
VGSRDGFQGLLDFRVSRVLVIEKSDGVHKYKEYPVQYISLTYSRTSLISILPNGNAIPDVEKVRFFFVKHFVYK